MASMMLTIGNTRRKETICAGKSETMHVGRVTILVATTSGGRKNDC